MRFFFENDFSRQAQAAVEPRVPKTTPVTFHAELTGRAAQNGHNSTRSKEKKIRKVNAHITKDQLTTSWKFNSLPPVTQTRPAGLPRRRRKQLKKNRRQLSVWVRPPPTLRDDAAKHAANVVAPEAPRSIYSCNN
eukprot:GHVT01039551.1.p1 GENE.GHVT01039551.1~~GHVT01039551.1.p1  ORF type:complete len:135 (+),score=18.50 GHVT01039551.1:1147-1551(+)